MPFKRTSKLLYALRHYNEQGRRWLQEKELVLSFHFVLMNNSIADNALQHSTVRHSSPPPHYSPFLSPLVTSIYRLNTPRPL